MRTTINRIGKYELRAVLARTPLSTVYDGWDSDIERRVAIKLLPLSWADDTEAGEAFARFKRGAQAAGQLNHPNIVGVYDYGETEDYAYLVMEFVDGSTLKGMFDDHQRFALPDICKTIGSILEALQYSHDRGVVHRDVKPANIMFTKDNQVKITDFGIARLENSDMTQAGMVIGTPAYMSPEQFLGEKIDWRTDIYSTGVVLYQMLTGERPYEGNLATIMHKVLYDRPLLPSRVSSLVTPALDAVVTRAMARNCEDRFRSAAEFNAALQAARNPARSPRPERIGAPSGASVSPVRPLRGSTFPSSSRMLLVSAVAACVLVAGGAAGWYSLRRPAQPNSGNAPPPGQQAFTPQAASPALDASPAAASPAGGAAPSNEPPPQAEAAAPESRLQALTPADQQPAEPVLPEPRSDLRFPPPPPAAAVVDPYQEIVKLTPPHPLEANPPRNAPVAKPPVAIPRTSANTSPDRITPDRRVAPSDIRSGKRLPDIAEQPGPDNTSKTAITEGPADSTLQRLRRDQASRPKPPEEVGLLPTPYAVTSSSAVGLVCQSVTAETAGKFGLDTPHGMVVIGVVVGSAAEKAGIHQDDVILKINGAEARDLSSLSKIAADAPSGQTVPVDILRRGGRHVVQLQVDALHH